MLGAISPGVRVVRRRPPGRDISMAPLLVSAARHEVAPWLRYLDGHRYWCRRSPTPDRPSPAFTRPGCAGRFTPKSLPARERHPAVMNGGTRPVCPNRGCPNCPSCPTIVFKAVGALRFVALDRLGHGTVRMCPRCPRRQASASRAASAARFALNSGTHPQHTPRTMDVRGLPRMLTARAVAGARREERRRRSWGISVEADIAQS